MDRFRPYLPEGKTNASQLQDYGKPGPKPVLYDPEKAFALEAAITGSTGQGPLSQRVGGIPWFHSYRDPET
jgi:hypothetical protein